MADGRVVIESQFDGSRANQGVQNMENNIQRSMQNASKRIGDTGKSMTKWVTGPIVGAVAGIGGLVKKHAEYGDELDKTSSKLGIGVEELQDWNYWAEQNGVENDALERGMGRLNQRIGEAINEGGKYADALDDLSVEYQNVDGSARDTNDVMRDTIEALMDVEDPALRSAKASDIFGTRMARDLMPALEDGSMSIEEATEKMDEFGRVSTEEAEQAAEFEDALTDLREGFMGIVRDLGADLLPILKEELLPIVEEKIIPALRDFGDRIKDIIEWFMDLDPIVLKIIGGVVLLAAVLGPIMMILSPIIKFISMLIPLVTGLGKAVMFLLTPLGLKILAIAAIVAAIVALWYYWDEIWDWIGEKLDDAVEWISGLVDDIVTFFSELPGRVWKWLTDLWGRFTEWLEDMWERGTEWIAKLIDDIVSFFSELPGRVWEWLTDLWKRFFEWRADMLKAAVEWASDLLEGVVEFFSELPGRVWEWLTDLWERFFEWRADMLEAAVEWASDLLEGVVEFFAEMPGRVWEWLTDLWERFFEWRADMLESALEFGSNILEGIVEFFAEMPGRIWDWLTDVLGNLVDWGSDMVSEAGDAASDLVDTVIDWISDLPGEMLEAGRNIISNLIGGIRDRISGIGDAMGDAASAVRDFLPFSPAKEGPLADEPDFGSYLGEGVDGADRELQHKIDGVMSNINLSAPGVGDVGGRSAGAEGDSKEININLENHFGEDVTPAKYKRKQKQMLRELATEWGTS